MEAQLEDVLMDLLSLFGEKEMELENITPIGGNGANTPPTTTLVHFEESEVTFVSFINPKFVT